MPNIVIPLLLYIIVFAKFTISLTQKINFQYTMQDSTFILKIVLDLQAPQDFVYELKYFCTCSL